MDIPKMRMHFSKFSWPSVQLIPGLTLQLSLFRGRMFAKFFSSIRQPVAQLTFVPRLWGRVRNPLQPSQCAPFYAESHTFCRLSWHTWPCNVGRVSRRISLMLLPGTTESWPNKLSLPYLLQTQRQTCHVHNMPRACSHVLHICEL